MSANWGRNLRLTIFGESHGPDIGVVIDGLPPGLKIDEEDIALAMKRRAPGQNDLGTPRKETDQVTIISGVYQGKTSGTPLCGIIGNHNTRSEDYLDISRLARPGHADYSAHIRYKGFNDPRGGGHFSGRITAPLVFAGAIVKSWLKERGIEVGAHILFLKDIEDNAFDPCRISSDQLTALRSCVLPTLNQDVANKMKKRILEIKDEEDSLGGVVECAVVGLPPGWGEPFFLSMETVISSLLFSIPAVKGVEFGSGFGFAAMKGSDANDAFINDNGVIKTSTNHNGGINGGITNGMPLIVKAAVKPTPSIAKRQKTVDIITKEEAFIEIKGRHDPCIVPRILPVIEAAVMLAATDIGLGVEING